MVLNKLVWVDNHCVIRDKETRGDVVDKQNEEIGDATMVGAERLSFFFVYVR